MRNDVAIRAGILSLTVHAIITLCALHPSWRGQPLLAPDSHTYILPAENMLRAGAFSRETAPPFIWEPYRTIGYPVLIAISEKLFGSVVWVMFFASVTAGVAAWVAIKMVEEWGGGRIEQIVCGIAAAFLPNSLGLSAQVLTDAIAGHLTLIWMYAIYKSLRSPAFAVVLIAGGLTVVLQSLKPTFNIIFIPILLCGSLFCRSKKGLITLTLLIAMSIPVPFFHAAMNNKDHNIFSPSLLGVETIREYFQVRALVEDNGRDYVTITEEVRRLDRLRADSLTVPSSPYGRLYLVKKSEVENFFKKQPLRVLRLAVTEMMQQLAAPQEFVFQLFAGDLPVWGRVLGSLLTLVFWIVTAWGAFMLGQTGDWRPGVLVFGVLVFFLATGSVSHFVGARLRFPADVTAIPLFAIGLAGLFTQRFRGQILANAG